MLSPAELAWLDAYHAQVLAKIGPQLEGEERTWLEKACAPTLMPSLFTHPIHLGLGATAVPQPEFSGMEWYAAYSARYAADGAEGRLVSLYRFEESWDLWEMHPAGDEVVVCLDGSITLIQERDGETTKLVLSAGEYAINAPGTWHTADVTAPVTALFITAGEGTEHRPREAAALASASRACALRLRRFSRSAAASRSALSLSVMASGVARRLARLQA